MKIAILGHGVEGESAEQYFTKHGDETTIFNPFNGTPDEIAELNDFDLVMRSPSIPPHGDWSSITKYFLAHCPCPIIGVTGTKGKGTTCSLIASLLEALGRKVWLVGNIGNPALDILDDIRPDDVVVYEMSSFQLWDVQQSPHFAVVLRIEPDHLNIHKDYNDYVDAKSHITAYQAANDFCVYYSDNKDSCKIAERSAGHKIPYPIKKHRDLVDCALEKLSIVGPHNRENAEAALAIVATFLGENLADLLKDRPVKIADGLSAFHGLPHRLELVRRHNNIQFYDDNFATNPASLAVALKSFPDSPIILIAGGRDKTDNADLPEFANVLKQTPNLKHTILIGESGHALMRDFHPDNTELQENLEDAVKAAYEHAKNYNQNFDAPAIVLMSPAAASFDMFKNAYERGDIYQQLVKKLK